MAAKKTIVFVHIPKNAGTTLHGILNERYTNIFHIKGINTVKYIEDFKKLSPIQQNSFEVVKGHLSHELMHLIDNPVSITYLRDPVDRFISSYYYLKRATWSRVYEDVQKIKSMEEYIDFAKKIGIDNVQARHLSGDVKHILNHDLTPTNFDEAGPALVEKAKENLKKIDYVFLTDQFDQSLMVLKKDFKWKGFPFYKRKNKTQKRKAVTDFDPVLIEKIKEVNKYDIELYELAKKQNTALLKKYSIGLNLKNFSFQNYVFQNKKRNKVYALYRKLKGN